MWVVSFYQKEIKLNMGMGREYRLEKKGVFDKGKNEYI